MIKPYIALVVINNLYVIKGLKMTKSLQNELIQDIILILEKIKERKITNGQIT